MPQLYCKNLTFGYDGKIVASDLSCTVKAGNHLKIGAWQIQAKSEG